ncbi:MAG: four-helix bundle copper-binding protein [Verrucomicrobiota bacterium JB022]|nr:four-helix bundle copper-binding protein [Verrucomicrobiota bacterium JB022]
MKHLIEILPTHPHPTPFGSTDAWQQLIKATGDCAATCQGCADACLAEEKLDMLRRCIQTDIACAKICETTLSLLLTQTARDDSLVRAQVETCEKACGMCAKECEQHAQMHAHCRICAEACRACEKACRAALAAA